MGNKKFPELRGDKDFTPCPSAPADDNNSRPPNDPNSQQIALAAAAQLLQQVQSAAASPPQAAMTSQAAVLSKMVAQLGGGGNSTASAADTLQYLSSILSSNSAANKGLLPNSSPVSSLLPALPALHAAPSPQSHISSQIAALISQVAATNSAATSTPSASITQPDATAVAAAAQQLAAAAAAAAAAQKVHAPSPAHHPHLYQPTAAAPVPTTAVSNGFVPPDVQKWSLEQLQQHVTLMEQLGQSVPQTISLLLADAKRKEEKRNAKRIANRKSASTSRARKKAYVQEMTELNARLKRQALILSLLPDMVLVIGIDGKISFCSAQVERVLRYDAHELVGVNLSTILVSSSKEKLNRLVKRLLGIPKSTDAQTSSADRGGGNKLAIRTPASTRAEAASDQGESNNTISASGAASGGENSVVPPTAVSEPSFPLSVVQVNAKGAPNGTGTGTSDDQNSDTSTSNPGKQVSSLTNSNLSSQSTAGVLYEGSSPPEEKGPKERPAETSAARNPSSDLSNSSSLSTNAKNLHQANNNLERNVRWHNKKMKFDKSVFKDDVTGADVTANNASARLSSLQHRPESSSSEEDDSGYRESNDSREETSSSVSDSSGCDGRRKPIAPTCDICLIRKDLTTLWCEVTSSIRTKEPDEDCADSGSTDSKKKSDSKSSLIDNFGDEKGEIQVEKELLLCLRPIRDGEHNMHDSKLRFEKKGKKKKRLSSEDDGALNAAPNRPFKKRGMTAEVTFSSSTSKTGGEQEEHQAQKSLASEEIDTDAAESLMLMNKAGS